MKPNKTAHVHFRVEAEVKELFKQAAKVKGLDETAWARSVLYREAKKEVAKFKRE